MNAAHPTLSQSLRALPRPAWILFFGTFLNKFGTFVMPFLALYLTQRGFSPAAAGVAIGGYGVGHFLASILGGLLADTIGRRKTIVLSMFSSAGAMLLLSQARSFPTVVALTVLAGLTSELYRPASSALLADLVPAGQRVTAFATYRMAFNAGWAFGPATAGFLATRGYFWLFLGDAITSVLYGIVALVALPRGVRSTTRESGWGAALKSLRRDRPFLQVLLASFGVGVVFFQMGSTFGLYVTSLGFAAAVYGAILSLNGVLVVLCELPLTTVTRRFPPRRVMAVGYALVGLGFALNSAARTVPALVCCIVIFTFGEMVAMPVSSAYLADLSPPNMRGRYMGAFGMTWALAMSFGPAFGMRLISFGPLALWLTIGGFALLSAGVILLPVKRTAPAPATI